MTFLYVLFVILCLLAIGMTALNLGNDNPGQAFVCFVASIIYLVAFHTVYKIDMRVEGLENQVQECKLTE